MPANLTVMPDLPDDIHVRRLDLDDGSAPTWDSFLSDAELERRSVMKNEQRRQGFTLGRVALRSLLAERMDIAPSEVPIIIEPTGRLACPESGLMLSLAHSGKSAIAVAANRNVGVDLEHVREKPRALLDYILADSEKQHIDELPIDSSLSLFLCWTLKEAVLKANGTGLRRSPRKVALSIDIEKGIAHANDPDGKDWVARFSIEEEYVLSLAFDPSPL